jgi:ATP-dependent DNA helicase Q4
METRIEGVKLELAQWERDFKAFHGKRPTITDAPSPILGKYRQLATLKKQNERLKKEEELCQIERVALPRAFGGGGSRSIARNEIELMSTAPDADDGFVIETSKRSFQLTSKKLTTLPAPRNLSLQQKDSSERSTQTNVDPQRSLVDIASSDHSGNSAMEIDSVEQQKLMETSQRTPIIAAFNNFVVTIDDLVSDDESDDDEISESSSLPEENTSKQSPRQEPNRINEKHVGSSLFSSAPKNEANYVRMNLKRGWRAKKRQKFASARKSRYSKDSTNFFSSSTDDDKRLVEKPDDVIDIILGELDPRQKTDMITSAKVPKCGHGMPCVELIVKKAVTGNKGRAFYGCSLGREGSCGFFLWKDDTPLAAREAFNGSVRADVKVAQLEPPAFINALSVSELKAELEKLGCDDYKSKKKPEMITQMKQIWIERMRKADELQKQSLEKLSLAKVLKEVFLHDAFLPGQRVAIERVLEKKNTLVVRATGSGKSLIYQMPAFLLPGISIVISPLISLMQDQIFQLPPGLSGCCLNGTQKEQAESLARLIAGLSKLLFVAPERLFASSFQTLLKKLPAVSLVCIDEAHCVSSWSHNFRPAYLRLGGAIQNLFPNAVVLALSATATIRVQREITEKLDISSVPHVEGTWMRENLIIQVMPSGASEEKRIGLLLELVRAHKESVSSSSSAKLDSTIVYATTKNDTRVLAERLENHTLRAAAYHSGMNSLDRKKIQLDFMRSKLPIVVATVAFGMGLNKVDVRKVIHYRTPRSIEEYVQEIGRAGRDGQKAACICLFDSEGEESRRLLALARSDGLEMTQIKELLYRLKSLSDVHYRSLISQEASFKLDCKESVLETILVFLEEEKMLELGMNGYARAEILFGMEKDRAPRIVKLARRFALRGDNGKFRVDLAELAISLSDNGDPRTISSVIRELCDARDAETIVNFTLVDRCWYLRRRGEWSEVAVENVLRKICALCDKVEERSCEKIKAVYSILSTGLQNCDEMKAQISAYLEGNDFQVRHKVPMDSFDDLTRRALGGDVQSLLKDPLFCNVPEVLRTSRAIVRILQAVASPIFTYEKWSSHRLWGRYRRYDYSDLKTHLDSIIYRT